MSKTFQWDEDKVLRVMEQVTDEILKDGAEDVLNEAKRLLTAGAKKPSGHLLREIGLVKSKYEGGGYFVIAQGKGHWTRPYHASFVELGTHKMDAIPFLRPAYKRHEKKVVWNR